jgi:uncharacterized protein YndB with AHSA1/START domain
VFAALTEPDQLRRWSAPEGFDVGAAEVDLRVGGAYRIRMNAPDGSIHTAYGTYREITRPERLVYSWQWEDSPDSAIGETLVTIELREADGGTELTLTHTGFPSEDTRSSHDEGWTSCFNRLQAMFA